MNINTCYYLLDAIGRHISIIIAADRCIIGRLLQAIVINLAMMCYGRIISGMAIGTAYVATPVYIREFAPKEHRGARSYSIQISFCIGYLLSTVINYCASFISGNASFRFILIS